MNHDISQSVSQRGDGANDEENRRIHEIADELQKLCRLHEKESRDGKTDGSRFEIEQRVAYKGRLSKVTNCYLKRIEFPYFRKSVNPYFLLPSHVT